MEESTANGLKQERRRRKRITQIRRGILSIFVIWFVFSVGICTSLLIKVHTLEEKMNYLLDNFTVSGKMEEESKQTPGEAGESAYFDLEGGIDGYEEDYDIAQAVNQKDNLAGPGDPHKVYLTFDDGPSNNTAQILDLLKKYQVKATFFVTGKGKERYGDTSGRKQQPCEQYGYEIVYFLFKRAGNHLLRLERIQRGCDVSGVYAGRTG